MCCVLRQIEASFCRFRDTVTVRVRMGVVVGMPASGRWVQYDACTTTKVSKVSKNYSSIAHYTKKSLMRWIQHLREQECF